MKKVLTVLILCIFLISCQANNTIDYLGVKDEEIPVCEEDCLKTYEDYYDFSSNYELLTEQLKEAIIGGYDEDVHIISRGEIISKDDINRDDPISENNDFLSVYPYYKTGEIFLNASVLVRFCSIENMECNEPYTEMYDDVLSLDYGFNNTSGFYNIKANDTEGNLTVLDGFFNFSDKGLSYEFFRYQERYNKLYYMILENGVYREYQFSNNSEVSFKYVNLISLDSMSYSKNENNAQVRLYNPESEVYYEMDNQGYYSVKIYSQNEFITSLSLDDTEYTYSVSLFYMNGWDTLRNADVDDSYQDFYSHVFLGETEVFKDYKIVLISQGIHYYDLVGSKSLSNEEWSAFELSEEFTGDVLKDSLINELELLTNMGSPYELIHLTEEELMNMYDEIHNMFIEN